MAGDVKAAGSNQNQDTAVLERGALSQGRGRWDGLAVSEAAFHAFVARVGADDTALRGHGADLVLACACAANDAAGLARFERTFVPEIDFYVASLRLPPEVVDELKQLVRVKLFTGPAPRIWQYSGKGPLGAWVRIVALRLAMDELEARPREAATDPRAVDALVSPTSAADHAVLREAWEPRLRASIEEGLARLPGKEKTILRLHYVEGLNIDAIGAIYEVHRATVARWLLAIRATLLREIRENLSVELPGRTSELRTLFQSLQSEIGISISRVLGG
jgi:RNA polymerase sigma-70 factor (ECF subfamily)